MILVTGATGRVGRALVACLLDRGVPVRALSRDPAAANLTLGLEVVPGDLAEPGSLEPALGGVESVFLLWPFTTSTGASALAPGVIEALARHVRRIVYLSAAVAADQPDSSWAAVERLIEASSMEWTFLRPTGFAANTLMWADQIQAGNVVRWPYGAAMRSLIHERDIAAVAARALADGGHAGRTYVLTGPEALAQSELVRIIGEAVGREVRWEELPPPAARQRLLAALGDPAFVDRALSDWAAFLARPEPVTGTVETVTVTGARAHAFRDWALEHVADFTRPNDVH
jgi:uncharacterized protein YbjT (DUF2867 family)